MLEGSKIMTNQVIPRKTALLLLKVAGFPTLYYYYVSLIFSAQSTHSQRTSGSSMCLFSKNL